MSIVLDLVLEAEKLFDGCDFPDKHEYLAIYDKFKKHENIGIELSARMHSLYFFLKFYYELLDGEKPDDYYPMITNGGLQKYAGIKLNIEKIIEMHDAIDKNQLERKNALIESRASIAEAKLNELRKLCESFEADGFTIEEYYGKLSIYDHATLENHFVEPDESDMEWVLDE